MDRAAASPPVGFSTRFAFILAAVGASVGLGNVWRFPYEAGQNGGAAFVAVYLLGLLFVAAPIFIAEVAIGRRGAASPPHALERQAVEHGRSRAWRIPGLFGVFANLLVMSFYSVIAGWTLCYMFGAAGGEFTGLDAEAAGAWFGELRDSPARMLFWQALFILMTVLVVARGVRAGIERAMRVMMPALGIVLLILVGHALIAGEARAALVWLFAPDFSKLTPAVALAAIGQAFFTLSVGIGGVMMYGAYLPKGASILRSTGYVVAADTAVAMLAGLAIFPIVFANGLDPAEGPGLVFVTLPLAFAAMPGGAVFGTLFFFFLFIAALTSAISLYEPTAAWFVERGRSRATGVAVAAGTSWLLGLLSIFSFNLWAEHDVTPFEIITGGLNTVILPVGALVIAWFAGRVLSREASADELGVGDGPVYRIWRFSLRWLTPLLVLAIFASNLSS